MPEDISVFLLVGLATGLVMVMTVQPIWGRTEIAISAPGGEYFTAFRQASVVMAAMESRMACGNSGANSSPVTSTTGDRLRRERRSSSSEIS